MGALCLVQGPSVVLDRERGDIPCCPPKPGTVRLVVRITVQRLMVQRSRVCECSGCSAGAQGRLAGPPGQPGHVGRGARRRRPVRHPLASPAVRRHPRGGVAAGPPGSARHRERSPRGHAAPAHHRAAQQLAHGHHSRHRQAGRHSAHPLAVQQPAVRHVASAGTSPWPPSSGSRSKTYPAHLHRQMYTGHERVCLETLHLVWSLFVH